MTSKFSVLLQCLAVSFSVLIASSSHAQKVADKPVVTGTFLGAGKDGNIQHLLVQTCEGGNVEPGNVEPGIKLVFTETDPASSKKPGDDALYKKLGSALIVSVFKDGVIFSCEVAHSAHSQSPFGDIGRIVLRDFVVTDTQVSGHVITPGELESFGQTWEVDLTFSAPLPKGAFVATAVEPKKTGKQAKLAVGKLALPAAARDVDYKRTVQHIVFNAGGSVSVVAGDFSTKLKQQGWTETPGSVLSKDFAILKRKRNDAELTALVEPAGASCTVQVFSEGLDWSEPPPFTPVPTATPDATPTSSGANAPNSSGATKTSTSSDKIRIEPNPKGF